MTISPFSSVRFGATVTPAAAQSSGQYEVAIAPGGKAATAYPNANLVLSASFWPTNATGTPADSDNNLLSLSLYATGVQGTSTHDYWVCYYGWNKWASGPYDLDGEEIATGSKPTLLGLYNGTPYTLQWGLFANKLANFAAFSATGLSQKLVPGGTVFLDGPKAYTGYTASGQKYDHVMGVTSLNTYLHVAAINAGGKSHYYTSNTYYAHGGYLQLVMVNVPGTYIGVSI
jgi:hypothetical protein